MKSIKKYKRKKKNRRKLKNKQEHQKSSKKDSSITPKQVDHVFDYKCFLKYVDIGELDDRIDIFRGLDFKKMSYEEVQSAICDVILFDTPKGKSSHMIRHDIPYPVGTRFYRVRTLSENDCQMSTRIAG